ncbi:MAG TPA: tyrosine--tRNA ligase [Candidatus Saccharimonadia bacterium]|nr:tyrosine--tRNA ligase [Candidatus Saccharimonadia bacterium]
MTTASLLDELTWRGLLYQYTESLSESLAAGRVSAYCGFDPTASSLHVGNLVPVMGLVHLQRAGHRPVALVGGGTGLIGDPSGKSSERPLADPETVAANSRALREQLERFLDFSGPAAAVMRDNAEWLHPLKAVEFLRDVGKHFTVNYMIAKESVRARMEEGISFTEFAYMLMQAYDYLELYRREKVTLQVGGSDQWGNITAGIELIRKVEGAQANALTFPLVTTSGGTKFGKTEAGAVWLDPKRTSPYRFFQFWINTDDRDTGTWLRFFTLKTRGEIEALGQQLPANPERREAQHALALDVTTRVHGEEAARAAAEVSALLFGGAEAGSLSAAALDALRAEMPFVEFKADGADVDVIDLFVAAKLVASKGAGRRLLEQGGIYVNNERLTGDARAIGDRQLLPGGHVLLRKGARDYALARIVR